MPTTSFTTAEAGAQITRSDYDWNATLGQALSISWAFRLTGSTADPDGVDGTGSTFQQFNSAQITAAIKSVQAWSDVANITFSRVGTGTSGAGAYSNNATLLLGDYTSGAAGAAAYAFNPVNKDATVGGVEGDVWINSSLLYNTQSTYTTSQVTYYGLHVGGYGAQVLTHEIDHALGLEHPGDYNASPGYVPTYDVDAEYVQDTRQYSIMSYFSETNTGADFKGLSAAGPLMDDIAAIQRLYGANTTAFGADTTYGLNSNTGRDDLTISNDSPFLIFCAYDTGGVDTFDFSPFLANQVIDLNSGPAHFSNVGGMIGNVSIYDGVVIENASGGSGADLIWGNGVANKLTGNEGADTLHGGGGADSLLGGAGADLMYGEAGNDSYLFDGTDTIYDSTGVDTVFVDPLSFTASTLSLANPLLIGIENLVANGAMVITLIGNDGANLLDGSDGANTLIGNGGADVLFGDGGADSLSGGEGKDALHGGDGNDTLEGGGAADAMQGDAGDDTYLFDGADNIVDSAGNDTVQVDSVTFGFGSISLANPNFSGIENLTAIGSGAIDLQGDGAGNKLNGSDGANSITGAGGNDFIDGHLGNDSIDGGSGNDTIYGGALDDDALFGGTGSDSLDGGSGNDTLDAGTGAGADVLIGGDGDDRLVFHGGSGSASGGNGADLLSADLSGLAVTATGTTISWSGGSITYAGIETFDITAASITGDLRGADGSETFFVTASQGQVTVAGGAEPDTLVVNYGATADSIFWVDEGGGQQAYRSGGNVFAAHYSGIERFNVTTGAGGDSIRTFGGDDTVRTGSGDDVIDSGAGAAVIDGGAGFDKWTADVSAATQGGVLNLNIAGVQGFLGGSVTGIEYVNLITGSGADVITTLGGASHQYNDVVNSGGGADIVTVGGGSDFVDMGGGADTLIVDYSWASDSIFTSDEGGGSFSIRNGGNTNRVSYLGVETFKVTTGSGSDNIVTLGGDDTISTGAGDDVIAAGAGANVLTAGTGTDTLIADYHASSTALKLDLNLATVQSFFGGTVQGFERLNLVSGSGADKVLTLVGATHFENDTIDTGAGDDTVTAGGNGQDAIVMGAGSDTLILDFSWMTEAMFTSDEGAGDYSLRTGGNTVRVGYSGVETFNIKTGAGADHVITFAGNDTISTGLGDDTIDAGAGVVIADAGGGTDLFVGAYATATDAVKLNLNLATAQAFLGGSLKGFEQLDLTTGSGADSIVTLVGGAVTLVDHLDTGAGDDTITAGSLGNDSFVMGLGTDRLNLDYSWLTDSVFTSDEGGGNYSIRNGGNTIRTGYSGVETFNLATGSGADFLITFAGADTISAGAGDDTVNGGLGANVLDAGSGVDLLIADFSAEKKAIRLDLNLTGAQAAGGGSVKGFDWVQLVTGKGADVITTLVGAAFAHDDVVTTNGGDDTVLVGSGSDAVDAGAGADTLVIDYSWQTGAIHGSADPAGAGSYASDGNAMGVSFVGVETIRISTGAGADTIQTGAGDDVISSGAGNDSLSGGAGDDSLTGGAGSDTMAGGDGKDVFVFTAKTDSLVGLEDRITDFGAGDKIDLVAIDAIAKTLGVNDAFSLVAKFTKHAGELVATYDSGSNLTTVSGDTDGNGKADFTIFVDGDHHTAASFIL